MLVEHLDSSGLKRLAAAAVDRGDAPCDGDPCSIRQGDDGDLCFALADGTGDWGDGQKGSRVFVDNGELRGATQRRC